MATLRNGGSGRNTEDKRKNMKRQLSAPSMRSPRVEPVAPLSVYRPTEESRLIPPLSIVEHSKEKDEDKEKSKKRPSGSKIDRTKAASLRKGGKAADTIAPLSVFRPSDTDSSSKKAIIAPMSVYKHSDEHQKPVAPLSVYKPDEKSHGIAPLSVYRPSDEGSTKVVAPLSVYKAEDSNKAHAAPPRNAHKPSEQTQPVAPLSIYRPEHKIVEPLSVYRSPNKGGIPPRSVFRHSASSESVPKHSDDDTDYILDITDESGEESKSPRSPRSVSPRSALQPPASPKTPRQSTSGSTAAAGEEEVISTSPKPAGLAAKMANLFSINKKSTQAEPKKHAHDRQKSNGSDKDDAKRSRSPKHAREKSNESTGAADRSEISPARSSAGKGGNSPSPSRKHARQTISTGSLTSGEPAEETKPVRKMRSNSTAVK